MGLHRTGCYRRSPPPSCRTASCRPILAARLVSRSTSGGCDENGPESAPPRYPRCDRDKWCGDVQYLVAMGLGSGWECCNCKGYPRGRSVLTGGADARVPAYAQRASAVWGLLVWHVPIAGTLPEVEGSSWGKLG